MPYADGYVIPVPKRKLAAYRRLARLAARVWLDHGALEVRETVAEDVDAHCGLSFPRALRVKRGETVVFSWIVYRSRADRDRVNAAVGADPRMAKAMSAPPPFDVDRMVVGGFDVFVDAVRRAAPRTRRR